MPLRAVHTFVTSPGRRLIYPAIAAILLATSACGAGSSAGASGTDSKTFTPNQTLEVDIPFAVGGGSDEMGREIVKIIQQYKLYPGTIKIENMPAGSGAVGWTYEYTHPSDPYVISTTSSSLFTLPLEAHTSWNATSFTPVAVLATDEDVIAVPTKYSNVTTLKQFVAKAKEQTPRMCGEEPFGTNYLTAAPLAQQGGFTLHYIPFDDQGSVTTATLSGNCDAILSNPSELAGLVKSGDLRVLGITGSIPIKMDGTTIPSFKQQGFDVEVGEPRGLILPPGTPATAQQWWINVAKKIAASPEWKSYVKANDLTSNVLFGSDVQSYFKSLQARYDTASKVANG